MTRRPFEGSYAMMLTIALSALVPYILVTTAYSLYSADVMRATGAGETALEVVAGIATAGYCFGALLAGDLINRIPQRHLFLICEAMFVAGCVVTALAGGTLSYGAGRILTGFATGLLLITALPPVIRRFPAERMPFSAVFINIGFFGAVTAGPLIGGLVAWSHQWRVFYLVLAGVGAVAWVLAFLTLPTEEPPNRDLPFDMSAILLGLAATVLPFWGAAELTGHGFGSPLFLVPMTVGLICFVALLVTEYRRKNALAPVKRMASTFPLIGTIVAMVGGGVLVTFLMLAMRLEMEVNGSTPLATGLSFWPQVLAVVAAAALVGFVLRTRYLPVLVLCGMVLLIAAGALLLARPVEGAAVPLLAAALLGLGAGTTVAPGLFLAGFSLPAAVLGRLFALIELVRSVADFILAPVMLKIARLASSGEGLTADGIHVAVWITLGLTVASALGCVGIYLAGTRRLPQPNLTAWLDEGGTAVVSPALGARFRRTGDEG